MRKFSRFLETAALARPLFNTGAKLSLLLISRSPKGLRLLDEVSDIEKFRFLWVRGVVGVRIIYIFVYIPFDIGIDINSE